MYNSTDVKTKYWAVIPAAGVGARMEADRPKQYLHIGDQTILEHTLSCFDQNTTIAGIVLVISAGDAYWPEIQDRLGQHFSKPILLAEGGEERCHSVLSGLTTLSEHAQGADWVLVHDAARPCLRQADLNKLIESLSDDAVGGLLALPVRDTLKRSNDSNQVIETVNRDQLWHALTPQMFRLNDLTSALKKVVEEDLVVTDEAQAMEFFGSSAKLIEGHPDNIKITRPLDLELAKQTLSLFGALSQSKC